MTAPKRAAYREPPVGFGALLRQHRIKRALSQAALGRLAGCDPAYINRFERGIALRADGMTTVPGRAVVLALAAALDVTQAGADQLLWAAGLAPQEDWQTRARCAEAALALIRQAFDNHAAGVVPKLRDDRRLEPD